MLKITRVATLPLTVLALTAAACGTKSVTGVLPQPLPTATPQPTAAPPTDATVQLPPMPTNLAPPPGERITVSSGRYEPGHYFMGARLGEGWHAAEDGTGWTLSGTCADLKRARKVKTSVPNRTRYRIELTGTASAVRLTVAAWVINQEITLENPELQRGPDRFRKKNGGRLPVNCGQGVITRSENGGRLEKTAQFEMRDLRGPLPLPVPSTLEIGDSKEEVAYLEALVDGIFSLSKQPNPSFSGASLIDSRPFRDVEGEFWDKSPSADALIRYTDGFKKATESAGPAQIHFGVGRYLPRKGWF
jgi:hypothetical protein